VHLKRIRSLPLPDYTLHSPLERMTRVNRLERELKGVIWAAKAPGRALIMEPAIIFDMYVCKALVAATSCCFC